MYIYTVRFLWEVSEGRCLKYKTLNSKTVKDSETLFPFFLGGGGAQMKLCNILKLIHTRTYTCTLL